MGAMLRKLWTRLFSVRAAAPAPTRPTVHVVGFWARTRRRVVSQRAREARAAALEKLYEKRPELRGMEPVRYPHPRHFVAAGPIPDAARIVAYLRSASVVRMQMGYSYCRLEGGPPDEEMGSAELSDGTWLWPEGLAVYVERFHVQLPDEFIAHMRAHEFVPPPCDLWFDKMNRNLGRWYAWAEQFGASLDEDLGDWPDDP